MTRCSLPRKRWENQDTTGGGAKPLKQHFRFSQNMICTAMLAQVYKLLCYKQTSLGCIVEQGLTFHIFAPNAGVSQAGAWTWLQLMGHGDMQRFNSSSLAHAWVVFKICGEQIHWQCSVCWDQTPYYVIPVIAQLVEHLTVDYCSNQMVPGSIPGDRICQIIFWMRNHGAQVKLQIHPNATEVSFDKSHRGLATARTWDNKFDLHTHSGTHSPATGNDVSYHAMKLQGFDLISQLCINIFTVLMWP